MYAKYIKRYADFTGALILILILSPIYILLYVLIRIFMGSPVLFIQDRPGKGEIIFRLYKFRSMNSKTDSSGELLPDEQRLTKLGSFLRKSSLDELPQFLNVLKGDMSFIGPRPLLVRYLPYYTETEKHRHNVRPGITGLAQINGRNAISWNDKLSYDVKYADNVTFWGDLKIAKKTILKVIKRSDISIGTEKFFDEERKEILGNIDYDSSLESKDK